MKTVFAIFIIAVIFFNVGCNQKSTDHSNDAVNVDTPLAAPSAPASPRPVHWGYSGENAPSAWATLDPAYAMCGTGTSQSPVNIVKQENTDERTLKIDYLSTSFTIAHNEHVDEIINNGHTIQITPKEGSTITINGKVFHLKQFHFHTPSEHTIDGKHAPMEMHMVHQSDDKSLAVIGLLCEEGAENKNFTNLISVLPNAPGASQQHEDVTIDIRSFLPASLSAYHYIGSLTTPPCTENVEWYVLKNRTTLSADQITAFSSRLKNNNRPVQSLNDRTVTSVKF